MIEPVRNYVARLASRIRTFVIASVHTLNTHRDTLEAIIFWIFILAAEVGWIVFLFCFHGEWP